MNTVATKEKKNNPKYYYLISNDKARKIIGVVSLLSSFIILGSLLSYIFTWQQDEATISNIGITIFWTPHNAITNSFGSLGAWISYVFIFEGFGVSSFLLCLPLFIIGVNLIFNKKIFSLMRNILFVIIGIFLTSTTLSLIFNNIAFPLGGKAGGLIRQQMEDWIGITGFIAFLFVAYVSLFIWQFNPTSLIFFNTKKESHPIEKQKNDQTKTPILNETMPSSTTETAVSNNTQENSTTEQNIYPSPSTEISKQLEAIKVIEKETQHTLPPQINNPLKETIPTPSSPPIEKEKNNISSHSIPLEIKTIETNEIPLVIENKEEPLAPPPIEKKKITITPSDLPQYEYPPLQLLNDHGGNKILQDPAELESNKEQIITTLKHYGINIQKISAIIGPTVTLYEIIPEAGVRISKIKNLEDDIALSLAALGIRIIAPIPGKGTIGIEVPNLKKTMVGMKTLLSSDRFLHSSFSLPIALGKKIDNENFIVDLATMPHLLMAGATGQGKSVGINALLVSLLYKKHPSELKLVLVDPKKVELNLYRLIENHFLAKLPGEEEPIITDTKKVIYTLNALCIEMDNRYDLLKEANCRNIKEYNEKILAHKLDETKGHQYLPFIVLVIDEFADLIMTAGKEIETPIARLAQLARAIGIHLAIATQRPSVNIITGLIKANFPARIAFKVSSKVDSRTILDTGGADQLIGKGDMLISVNGEVTRLQCAFVDTPEVDKICEWIAKQEGYPTPFFLPEYIDEKELNKAELSDIEDRDPMFENAARLIVQMQQGSASLIQRKMKLGYNRAGRIMDQLEKANIVGPAVGSKTREVKCKTEAELNSLLS